MARLIECLECGCEYPDDLRECPECWFNDIPLKIQRLRDTDQNGLHNSMVPAKQNITIMRGDTEVFNITLTDSAGAAIDLTGSTFLSQIRYERDSSTVAASFTCSITNAAAGQVALTLSSASSAGLTAGTAFWDLQRTLAGVVTTLVAGKCTILADVTRQLWLFVILKFRLKLLIVHN